MADHEKYLQSVHDVGAFFRQLVKIIKRLQERRPLSSLHTRADHSVKSGENASDKRCREYGKKSDNNPNSHATAPPTMMIIMITSIAEDKIRQGFMILSSPI